MNFIIEYEDAIISKKVIAGKHIKRLYKILVQKIETGDYIFNEKKAITAIKFIENFCRHSEGRDDLITLELWQKALISAIFGIYKPSGTRQFREIVVIVGRKNGKSLLASAICACELFIGGEYGAKIYCVATKLEQAKLVYTALHQMIMKEPELAELSKKRRDDIYIESTNSVIKPLAFNANKADGLNPQVVVNDEIAAWRGAAGLKQYEVMKSALGAREQPFILSISTAGYENGGIYDELFKRGKSVLDGTSSETELLPVFYMIDDETRWDEISEISKANPNIGVSVKADFFREEIAVAKSSESKRAEFLTKYCNVKQNNIAAWLDFDIIDKAMCDKKIDEFHGCYALGGIDLSQTTDLTAAACLIEKRGVIYCFCQFFMPAEKIRIRQEEDNVPYELFVSQGFITPSEGNFVNYHDVFDWFVNLRESHNLYFQKIGYDRYSAKYLIDDLERNGFSMDDVFQGENLAGVIREFEGILRNGKFKICGNNLLKAHFLNVSLKHNNETRKFRPVKTSSRSRIDGFVAAIDALTVRQKWWDVMGEYLKNGNV